MLRIHTEKTSENKPFLLETQSQTNKLDIELFCRSPSKELDKHHHILLSTPLPGVWKLVSDR